jgi:hypothetical protein
VVRPYRPAAAWLDFLGVRDASHHPPVAGAHGPATVRRPRVTALLSAARQRRATLVVAGAGYGKTTALAEVAALGAARWVRLRPADGQAESLSARIAAALGQSPSPARSAIAAATGSDDRRVLAERRAALLCELAETLPGDLLLVIDGLEHVGGDEAASYLLRVLSLEAPSALHLVPSGRSLPELGLGGAQGRGELLEVTAPDLSFTAGEAAELVWMRLGAASAPLAPDCWSLTGGWPAALQLLLDRLERLDSADQGRALRGFRRGGGHVWRAFARDLVDGEDLSARRVLSVESLAPHVDVGLLEGVAVTATASDLEGRRNAAAAGLLMTACSSSSTSAPPPPSTAPVAATPAASASASGSASAPAAAAASAGLSGTWSGTYSGPYQGTFTQTWRQSSSLLSGTIKLSNPPGTLPIHGTVAGGAIRFGSLGSLAITYSGTVSGNSMSGTYQVHAGNSASGPWSASRAS